MGVKKSPDVSQEIMEDTLPDIEEVNVYINDVGCFDSSWQQHLRTLECMLSCPEAIGFSNNPLKCEWGVEEAVVVVVRWSDGV